MSNLSAENAYIFRITHIDNLPWLLTNGVQCRTSSLCDPNFHEIGNRDLISKRNHREVPIAPKGTLSDYVPFYFTPYSPMLLNIKTGYNGVQKTPMSEIVILVSSLHHVAALNLPFVFTDRHAYLEAAQFSADLNELDRIDWGILQNRDFKRDPNDPGKVERYQAEALIHNVVPVTALQGIACYGSEQEQHISGQLSNIGLSLKAITRPGWYF